MNQEYSLVRQFHLAFGIPVSRAPKGISVKRRRFRAKLLREEVREFVRAENLVEETDALLDIIYLALGGLVELGVKPAIPFKIVHRSNLAKRWPNGTRRRNRSGKPLKPPQWVSPSRELRKELDRQKHGSATRQSSDTHSTIYGGR